MQWILFEQGELGIGQRLDIRRQRLIAFPKLWQAERPDLHLPALVDRDGLTPANPCPNLIEKAHTGAAA